MKKIYSTYKISEACMIKDLLQQQGIVVVIKGENIDAKLGQPVTIWVDSNQDEEKANEIISSFVDRKSENSSERDTNTAASGMMPFFAGLIIGIFSGIILFILFNAGTRKHTVQPVSWDTNSDGKKDTWAEYSGGKPVKYCYDRNLDEKADHWSYLENGLIARDEIDLNLDGKADVWQYFESSGKLSRVEYDFDYDGKAEYWEYFKEAQRNRFTADNDRDGNMDEWGIFEKGFIKERNWSFKNDDFIDKKAVYEYGRKIKELYDRDRNGSFDEEITLDEFERVIKTENK